jgi:hypothetical protein
MLRHSPHHHPLPTFSIASYYYNTSVNTATDGEPRLTATLSLGTSSSATWKASEASSMCNNGGWPAPSSHLQVPHGTARPARFTEIARPTPTIGPSEHSSHHRGRSVMASSLRCHLHRPTTRSSPPRRRARDGADEEYADESTQVVRLRQEPRRTAHASPRSHRIHHALLTPKSSNMPLPTLALWRAEEIPYLPNQEVSIVVETTISEDKKQEDPK